MTYNISTAWTTVIIILAIWELVWKGIALWVASHKDQKGWFIALLVLNTVGILPIIYLLTHVENLKLNKGFGHEKAVSVKG